MAMRQIGNRIKNRINGLALTIAAIIFAVSCPLTGCGILTQSNGSKTLINYFEDSEVVGARFYYLDGDGEYRTEELPAERLGELVETVESMNFRTYSFHTDYFWGGRFGIEFDLESGHFLTYDGTKLTLRSAARASGKGSDIRSTFAEVKDLDFTEEMSRFFESAAMEAYEW